MEDVTSLQQEVLEVINEYAKKDMFAFATCDLTNNQIYSKLNTKPSSELYITRVLRSLREKGKIKTERKMIQGKGLKRIITIL